MRLLTGLLSAQLFESTLEGDEQLLRRPMRRVTEPLGLMGALIHTNDGHAPIDIIGTPLHGIEYAMPIASAQVKSALLLAGLYADDPTIIHQPGPTRDHTERMLNMMGASVLTDGSTIQIDPCEKLSPLSSDDGSVYRVPGDISSAAFLLVAALLVTGSRITIENVGINPTRTGFLDVLTQMGAKISLTSLNGDISSHIGEPVSDITVENSVLKGIEIRGDVVVRMIDEFPILAVAATQAQGTTIVHDAEELRVKETDRIAAIVLELKKLGANIEALPDGFIVEGPTPLRSSVVDSHNDHRLAMALSVAGLITSGEVIVNNVDWIGDSFPGYISLMQKLGAQYT
jgi:3-phosphoshikimate 1-carboxyvinyltransferase